jgi:hypothetical protein
MIEAAEAIKGAIKIEKSVLQLYPSADSFSTEMGIPRHVRFTPDSHRIADIAGGPVRAIRRHSGDVANSHHISGTHVCRWGSTASQTVIILALLVTHPD